MENLKDYRISLKFSEKESDQKDVAKLLKQLGRKKSSFITKAIKYYLENNPSPEIPGTNNVITNMLTENVVKATILKMIKSGELTYNDLSDEISKKDIEELPNKSKDKKEKIKPETKSEIKQEIKKDENSNSTIEEPSEEDVDYLLDLLNDFSN